MQNTIGHVRCDEHEKHWTDRDWIYVLPISMEMPRFQICMNEGGRTTHIRAIQGHRGEHFCRSSILRSERHAFELEEMIFHTGSSRNYRSIVETGLWAGGIGSRRSRQACFFSALNPQEPDSLWDTDKSQDPASEPPNNSYKHRRRPEHDCICHFNMELAQQQKAHILPEQPR